MGTLQLRDEDVWNEWRENNQDAYGKGVVDFAERWGVLMQEKIEDNSDVSATIASVAKETSSEADTEGITGFMYGCAVQVLASCWVYGEELRRWHNIDTQIGTEGERANESGGVLNPAMLNISDGDE